MSLQDGFRIGIGFLQIHAPILQLFERDRYAGHRAAHECAGPHDTEVAVEIFDLGLTCHWGSAIGSVQHVMSPHSGPRGLRPWRDRDETQHSGSARRM